MATMTIFEAKTNLSELVRKAQKGEEVIITSGRSRTPVVKMSAIEPVKKKRLGLLADSGYVLPESFFDPLPPGWDGIE
jgi:prevent-host-death family protein